MKWGGVWSSCVSISFCSVGIWFWLRACFFLFAAMTRVLLSILWPIMFLKYLAPMRSNLGPHTGVYLLSGRDAFSGARSNMTYTSDRGILFGI